jgi:hypothetical protein
VLEITYKSAGKTVIMNFDKYDDALSDAYVSKSPLWDIVKLPKIEDDRGNLTFIEGEAQVPFKIARAYYLYDVPGGSVRAGHAHKELQQLLIATSGSFDVNLDDGVTKQTFTLNRGYIGLMLKSMVWRTLSNFSSGAVCMVLASTVYDESDYFREYGDFMQEYKRLQGEQ